MLSGPWPGIIAAAIVLILITIWSSYGSGDERQARSAILEAQRHILRSKMRTPQEKSPQYCGQLRLTC